jgi:hypothetical protein
MAQGSRKLETELYADLGNSKKQFSSQKRGKIILAKLKIAKRGS